LKRGGAGVSPALKPSSPKEGGRDARPTSLFKDAMSTKQKWFLLVLASLALSLAVPLALGGLSQFRLVQRLSWGALLLLTSLQVISWAFNALRIQFLLGFLGRNAGFREAALIAISAEFAGVTTPGGVGMPATYIFLFNRLGLSLGGAAGVVGISVVTDLAVYATIIPLAAGLLLLRWPATHQGLYLALVSLALMAGGAFLLWNLVRHHRRFYRFIGVHLGKVPWLVRHRWRLGRTMVDFLRAVRLLGQMSWAQRWALFLITLNFWLPRYLILFLVIDMVGQSVPTAYLLLAQVVMQLGGQALATPGGAGTVDVGYALLMRPYMSLETIAFTLLVWRTYTYYWFLIVGGPIFLYKTGKAAWELLGKGV
jgi:uncharacterized protein (TIRG00374 family)